MLVFVLSVAAVLVISAFCSVSEAGLYSVRMPYVRSLAEEGHRSGEVLEGFKRNMERPITAILIVNTVANTAGATVAGGQAEKLFGDSTAATVTFTVLFTLGVLFFSEILPKVAGVSYNKAVARAVSLPWALLIRILHPLVWASQLAAKWVQKDEPAPLAPEEEVHQVAELSAEEGSILREEAHLVKNVLRLDQVQAKDIMTPRTVVFRLPAGSTVGEVFEEAVAHPHSRIPIHGDDSEDWQGFVFRSDILAMAARQQADVLLTSLRQPLAFVPEVVAGHRLLSAFLKRKQHILGVVDEYGGMAGVVTLEDVMESLLGAEIVDETDVVADLQQAARLRAQRNRRESSDPES
ncbi:MAG: hemolysin family protein [Acidobacteriota bacterium]